jgi:hypothetical protein
MTTRPRRRIEGIVDCVHTHGDGQPVHVKAIYYTISGGAAYHDSLHGIADGTTAVTYWAVDNRGNTEDVHDASVRIDRAAPSTSDDAPDSWTRGPLSLLLTAVDTTSGVAATHYSLDGSEPSLLATGPITVSEEGTTTLKYSSTDNAGNSEAVMSTLVRVDSCPSLGMRRT